jgi:predicted small lipoprotein YifL
MRAPPERGRSAPAPLNAIVAALAVAAGALAGCARKPTLRPPSPYASAEQVEMNFRGKRFILGDNDQVAEVRPPDWPQNRRLKLPFWLGINILVPGVLQPKQGDYYVVSEADLIKRLDNPDTWLISAGSHLIKQEAVFVTTKTHYLTPGKILPTIVQFSGLRYFTGPGGKKVGLPVLTEVSLPMKWTFKGEPHGYARYHL